MSQYRKTVFNLAPGPGEAINDPRVQEAALLAEQRRADMALAQQAQQAAVQQSLAQQDAAMRAQALAYQQQNDQAKLQAAADQFQQEMAFRSGQAGADRQMQAQGMNQQAQIANAQMALQRLLAGQQADLTREGWGVEAQRFNAGNAFTAQQNDLNRALQQQGMTQEQTNADRAYGLQQGQFDFAKQQAGVAQDQWNQQFGLQQGQFGAQLQQNQIQNALAQAQLGMQVNTYNAQIDQQNEAARQAGYAWIVQNAKDLLTGRQTALTSAQRRQLQLQGGPTETGVNMILSSPAMKDLAAHYYTTGVQPALWSVIGSMSLGRWSPESLTEGNLNRLNRATYNLGQTATPPTPKIPLPQVQSSNQVMQAAILRALGLAPGTEAGGAPILQGAAPSPVQNYSPMPAPWNPGVMIPWAPGSLPGGPVNVNRIPPK